MNSGMNAPGPGIDEYETPPWLFKALDAEFGFDFDAAASAENHLCEAWTDDIGDGILNKSARVFCNPPYSKIEQFVAAALYHPGLMVLLLPNRTDTGWFQRLRESSRVELRFLRKRVRFYLNGKEMESPRFGSLIAVVRPE